jgi:hypothetical protein
MAQINDINIEINTKLTVDPRTADTLISLLNLFIENNNEFEIIAHDGEKEITVKEMCLRRKLKSLFATED